MRDVGVTVNLIRSRGRQLPMAPRRCRATWSLPPASDCRLGLTPRSRWSRFPPCWAGPCCCTSGGLAMARPWDGIRVMPVKGEQDGRIRVQRAVLANSESHAKLTHTCRSRFIARFGLGRRANPAASTETRAEQARRVGPALRPARRDSENHD